jgi:hypothetical protein
MAKSGKKAGRKAPKASRNGASNPSDAMRMHGEGADLPGSREERIAEPAGARDERLDDSGAQAAENPSAMRNVKKKNR